MANLDAPIVEVTVFVDRARITRRGSTVVQLGQNILVIANVPRAINEDTLRTSGKGAGVTILGVEVVTRYVTSTPVVDAVALQKNLDDLLDQDRVLVDEDSQCAAQIDLLKSLRENTGSRLPVPLPMERPVWRRSYHWHSTW